MEFPSEIKYRVTADWDGGTGGTVNAGGYWVEFDTPITYGGKGKASCPDQLFLASMAGCIINTFLNFKKRLNVITEDVHIESEMDIHMHNPQGYRIDEIRLKIKVFTTADQLVLNHNCAKLALDYCHIIQSIKAAIPIVADIKMIKV